MNKSLTKGCLLPEAALGWLLTRVMNEVPYFSIENVTFANNA